jgi:hypothetical protein
MWSGQLTEGLDVVVVFPALWEWDSDQDPVRRWEATLASESRSIQSDTARLNRMSRNQTVVLPDFTMDKGLLSGILEGGHDRPIGFLEATPGGGLVGFFFDTLFGKDFVFPVKAIVLTVDTIEKALNNPSPKGAGVVEVRLPEAPDLAGDYTLYLQIDRVP